MDINIGYHGKCMIKLLAVRYSLVLGISLVISGCGGGGGGGGSKTNQLSSTATPVSSSSAIQSSASTSSLSSTTQLTIQGAVDAEALAGGEIVFTIGPQNYKAAINNSLKYSIALNIPLQYIDKPFVAIAAGSGVNNWAQLAATYPSIKALAEKAGSDNTLNADEYFGVNITALTTAQYSEIKNQSISLESDENRKNAFLVAHPMRILEKTAFITKIFSDLDFKLPKSVLTTLDFLSDENLSETYIEISRIANVDWVHPQIASMQTSSIQNTVASAKISGTYFLEALNYAYVLSFNENGTGNLQAASMNIIYATDNPTVNASFTWARTGKKIRIQFSQPITYSVDYYHNGNSGYVSCNNYFTENTKCNLTFNSIDIDLVTDTDFGKFAYIRPDVTVVKGDRTLHNGELNSDLVSLINTDDLFSISRSDLIGHEWYAPEYRYVFSENGSVLKTDLVNNTTKSLAWELKDKHVVVGTESLWIVNKNVIGYGIISVDESRVFRKSLFKRYDVNMAESDWVGRWTSYPFNMYTTSYDVNANKTWRDGFEAEGAGSWSTNDSHTQTAISNGTWMMRRDVLAIHDDKYYMSVCQGQVNINFVPYNCYLSVATKSSNFDSNVFWGSWSYPVFNEKKSGKDWMLIDGRAYFTNTEDLAFTLPYTRVSVNKLYNNFDETILEMTSAGKNEIELCEYKFFESCAEENKRVYQRGIELKLVTNEKGTISVKNIAWGPGSVIHTYERNVVNTVMIPKGTPQIFIVKPDSGLALASNAVAGCGGTLIGQEYRIPARTEPCEITVRF